MITKMMNDPLSRAESEWYDQMIRTRESEARSKEEMRKRTDELFEKWDGVLKTLSGIETLCDWNGCPHCRNRR